MPSPLEFNRPSMGSPQTASRFRCLNLIESFAHWPQTSSRCGKSQSNNLQPLKRQLHIQAPLCYRKSISRTEAGQPTASQPAPNASDSPKKTQHTQERRVRSWNLSPQQRPSHSTDNSLDLVSQLRHVFRHFPQPVVICTSTSPCTPTDIGITSDPNPSPRNPQIRLDTAPLAMTMSSLTPLSMNPTAVVSLNIMTPSRTLDAIQASGRFAVHILAPNTVGTKMAQWFAQRHPAGDQSARSTFHGVSEFATGPDNANKHMPSATEGFVVRPGDPTMPPILGGSGVLFAFVCRLPDDIPRQGVIQIRDHAIVIGEVEEVVPGAAESAAEDVGVVHALQKFWRMSDNHIV